MDAEGLSHLIDLQEAIAQLNKLTSVHSNGEGSSGKNVIDSCKKRCGALKVTLEDVSNFLNTVKDRGETTSLESVSKEGPHIGKLNFNIAAARLVLLNQVKLLPAVASSGNNNRSRNNLDSSKIRELEATFKTLNTHRLEIIHAFWHLQHRYLQLQIPQRSLADNPSQPWCHEDNTDALIGSFLSTPFQVQVEVQRSDILLQLHNDEKWRTHMLQTFERVGRRWTEVQLINEDTVTVSTLGRVQLDLLRHLQASLHDGSTDTVSGAAKAFKAAAKDASANREVSRFDHVIEVNETIHRAIKRIEGQKFSIAFCGMVKAGKSLFLNAMIGRIILPSDELPSTAWPCRIRHVPGQLVPKIDLDTTYFQKGIDQLYAKQYGRALKDYTPPDDDPFAGLLDELDGDESVMGDGLKGIGGQEKEAESELRMLYSNWIDLHPFTKKNLTKFEKGGYKLASSATGHEGVINLLGEINDIVRLCKRLGVPLDTDNAEWPLLSIEFNALKGEEIDGVFEFVDLPGIGESFEEYSFEDLLRKVSTRVDAFVPIVSFKEVPKDDWRKLPRLISDGLKRAPDMVVCTHLDQISRDRVPEQVANVAKVFWPSSPGTHSRVLACSSRLGLSAYTLRERSRTHKPRFQDFWGSGKTLEYDCAERILGVGTPEINYKNYTHEDWLKAINDQLHYSGLVDTITRITTDMVKKSQQRALIYEGEQIRRQLHKAAAEQSRILIETSRTEKDFEAAYKKFLATKSLFKQTILKSHAQTEAKLLADTLAFLRRTSDVLDRQSETARVDALKVTTQNPRLDLRRGSGAESSTLEFRTVQDAEDFLRTIQVVLNDSLSKLKKQYVGTVRALANKTRTSLFNSLKKAIQETIRGDIQPELKEEIIDELDERSDSVEKLVISNIRKHVVRTVATRYNARSAFNAIEETIARPFLGSRDKGLYTLPASGSDSSQDLDERKVERMVEEERSTRMKELGFMLRAPIAVVAAIPWVLGAGVWPFMAKSKKYYLDMKDVDEELLKRVVQPFITSLKEESEKTIRSMVERTSQIAKEAVEGTLGKEEQRYGSERSRKGAPREKAYVASVFAALCNFIAGQTALLHLQDLLKETI